MDPVEPVELTLDWAVLEGARRLAGPPSRQSALVAVRAEGASPVPPPRLSHLRSGPIIRASCSTAVNPGYKAERHLTVSSALIGWSPSSSEESLSQADGFKSRRRADASGEREWRLSTAGGALKDGPVCQQHSAVARENSRECVHLEQITGRLILKAQRCLNVACVRREKE